MTCSTKTQFTWMVSAAIEGVDGFLKIMGTATFAREHMAIQANSGKATIKKAWLASKIPALEEDWLGGDVRVTYSGDVLKATAVVKLPGETDAIPLTLVYQPDSGVWSVDWKADQVRAILQHIAICKLKDQLNRLLAARSQTLSENVDVAVEKLTIPEGKNMAELNAAVQWQDRKNDDIKRSLSLTFKIRWGNDMSNWSIQLDEPEKATGATL